MFLGSSTVLGGYQCSVPQGVDQVWCVAGVGFVHGGRGGGVGGTGWDRLSGVLFPQPMP